jgi:L-asparaginase
MNEKASVDVSGVLRRRALLIGAGGTIAMVGRSPYDWVEYGESGNVRSIGEVVEDLNPLLPDVDLELISFRAIASTGIEWKDWIELSRLVRELCATRSDFDGIVITHGTASLEETAWFLEVVLDVPVPVVFVGAQRPPNTSGSDAGPNLRAAVAVATAAEAKGLGVLVVMNNSIFAARDVRKSANFALEAFVAPEFGPLGRVEASGAVTIRRRPVKHSRKVFPGLADVLTVAKPARVDIALSYAGADGTAIQSFRKAGAAAIISLGMPPGRCTPAERAALREAVASGVLVVQTSRAPEGAVVPQKYNTADGIYSGGDLAANKLRILLMIALSTGVEHSAIGRLLAEY